MDHINNITYSVLSVVHGIERPRPPHRLQVWTDGLYKMNGTKALILAGKSSNLD
jgi:hypothetical protein